jgi:hypothetical protein
VAVFAPPNAVVAVFAAPNAPKGLGEAFAPRVPNGEAADPESAPNLEFANIEAELAPPKMLTPELAVAKGDLEEVFAKPLFSDTCTRQHC